MKNIKKRDFIATHTFHSPSARKAFFDTVKDRKKNSDWWGNETAEVKEKFLLALKHRKIVDSVDIEKDQSTDYALMLQIFLGKGDFFFCHWLAESEEDIHAVLRENGRDQLVFTACYEISIHIDDRCLTDERAFPSGALEAMKDS